jgi:hypothetical protein
MKYQNIREEELKNKVAQEYFWIYDCSKIIGNVDFCVSMHQTRNELFEQESLLWAEAKTGSSDIYKSLVQLILTIGKARTFDKFLPPALLGGLDGEKIAFVPFNEIHDIFYLNDFNWNVTPSNHGSREFKLIHEKVKTIVDKKALLFDYQKDDKELKNFIKRNFIVGKFGLTKTKIDKNNFMVIYNKWLQTVKPSIAVNWEVAKKSGIIDGDFYLADLLSQENNTLKEKLFVLLNHDHYELDRKLDDAGMFSSKRTDFKDKQVAHTQFWNKYDRPPREEYWNYIVERRDLLVPQDVRERKGSYFTPQIWVELSQKYLSDFLGDNWQEEYYIWDCAAGTGNLLNGLTNKYNIWASTLDKQDVEVMHDRIKNGANLLDEHVFQFDFLNDDFVKLPLLLQEIINNPDKRKKLVIYINPPYKRGLGVANTNWHSEQIGEAKDELYIQFLYRIYSQINGCKVGVFSKLKLLNAPDFETIRLLFRAKLEKLFVVPANTFDNVKGKFPIGFQIYDLDKQELFNSIIADVYDENRNLIGTKEFSTYNNSAFLNKWLIRYKDKTNPIGKLVYNSNDFQHQNRIRITNFETVVLGGDGKFTITKSNLIVSCIYFTVRHCIDASWLNDRDQYLQPDNKWETDTEFQNDCLTYAVAHNQNFITSKDGTNNWIPFTEQEVNAREKFESNFMSKFINGKLKTDSNGDLFSPQTQVTMPLRFSSEATTVLDSARDLWKYYLKQPDSNVNYSLYDIKEYFQGRNEFGKMNNKSSNLEYMNLIGKLRENLRKLAAKIEPKVFAFGFLKG